MFPFEMPQRFKGQLRKMMMNPKATVYDYKHETEFEDFNEFIREFEAK